MTESPSDNAVPSARGPVSAASRARQWRLLGAAYRAAVLPAFQNVADSLRALELDRDALAAAERAATATERSFAIAQRQLELGATSRLAFVAAEQSLPQARLALAQAEASRYADSAALFQALGGGLETNSR